MALLSMPIPLLSPGCFDQCPTIAGLMHLLEYWTCHAGAQHLHGGLPRGPDVGLLVLLLHSPHSELAFFGPGNPTSLDILVADLGRLASCFQPPFLGTLVRDLPRGAHCLSAPCGLQLPFAVASVAGEGLYAVGDRGELNGTVRGSLKAAQGVS